MVFRRLKVGETRANRVLRLLAMSLGFGFYAVVLVTLFFAWLSPDYSHEIVLTPFDRRVMEPLIILALLPLMSYGVFLEWKSILNEEA